MFVGALEKASINISASRRGNAKCGNILGYYRYIRCDWIINHCLQVTQIQEEEITNDILTQDETENSEDNQQNQ